MAILEIVDEINLLKEQYDSLKPFRKEDEERLWRKLRLEWNYNSNHIEGNTLTYGETELLLYFRKTGEGTKDLRDYEEMKAHDVTIRMVKELAEDKERDLTETFIRQLNEVLLVEPFYKDAITADKTPTKKKIIPGQYKTTPNSVITATGEEFSYASVEETPALMTELIDWYRKAVVDNEHPLYIASLLHYRFVRIHPFDDGNGRTARLLANYVLMKYGYPPTVIKSDDKSNYIGALNQADTGNTQAFVEYIGKTVIAALEMAIKAGKGESIEELGDWEKELELLKRPAKNNPELRSRTPQLVQEFYFENIESLFKESINTFSVFDDLFAEKEVSSKIDNYDLRNNNDAFINKIGLYFESDVEKIKQLNASGKIPVRMPPIEPTNLSLTFFWKGYKPNLVENQDLILVTQIKIYFGAYFVELYTDREDVAVLRKSYSETISVEEQKTFIEIIGKILTKSLKSNLGID